MRKIEYYNYLNDKVKVFTNNFKRVIKYKSYNELDSYDYNSNYHIWDSYDYFINKVIENSNINENILVDLNNIKTGNSLFSDIKLIKRINNKYKDIINYIEKETGLVYGLDYIQR